MSIPPEPGFPFAWRDTAYFIAGAKRMPTQAELQREPFNFAAPFAEAFLAWVKANMPAEKWRELTWQAPASEREEGGKG